MSVSAEDLERIVTTAVQAANKAGNHVSVTRTGGDGGFRRLVDGLLVLAVASIVAIVWKLSNNVSVLATQVTYLSAEVAALRAK